MFFVYFKLGYSGYRYPGYVYYDICIQWQIFSQYFGGVKILVELLF